MHDLKATINNIATNIQSLGPVIAGAILVLIGFAYMLASTPQKKETIKEWGVRVAVGLALVYLAAGIIKWFKGQISVGA